jgi:hypothetical protein
MLQYSILLTLSIGFYGCLSESQIREIQDTDYSIVVNYDQPLADLVEGGNYYWAYSELSEKNFPTTATSTMQLAAHLVKLNGHSTIEQVLDEQKRKGLRSATIRELLALGMSYPDLQNKVSIVGFGSCKNYFITTYLKLGSDPDDIEEVRLLERFFPCLVHDLFGRAAVLMQEDMIPSYHPGAFYACFIAPN